MKRTSIYCFLGLFFFTGLAHGQFLFKDVTGPAGIYMRSNGVAEAGPGVVVFDLNSDGWDDIYMTGGFDSDKIFLNMHDGTFKDVTPPNVSNHSDDTNNYLHSYPRGGIALDYDNDGYTDLYITCQNNDLLWHNNGDGTFTNKFVPAHLVPTLDQNQSMSASFGDFRGVGLNDIYVARWVEESKYRLVNGHDVYAHKGFPNFFYINNGDGTFTESAKAYGVDGDTGTTNIALFFDYDRDGDLDLLIGNDFGVAITPNQVWKNMLMETGKATFVDVTKEIGLQDHIFCMGIGPCDYNRDGNFDFFETSAGPDSLMRNNGNGTFTNVSNERLPAWNGYERGDSSYITVSWSPVMADFDNDGWEDAFIVHGFEGILIPPAKTNTNDHDTSIFYRNVNGHFVDATNQALGGKYLFLQGGGGAYLDYNHDGNLDLVYASASLDPLNTEASYSLFENITQHSEGNPGHWIEARFIARRTAKEGIGTIMDVWAGGVVQSRQVSTGGGFASQNSLMQHVGLGSYSVADSLIVYWPCDKNRHRQIDKFYNVPADHMYYITENMNDGRPDTLAALGVQNAPAKQAPSLYPNPAGNTLNVQNLGSLGRKHFEIYDLLGIKHLDLEGSDNNFSFSVGNLKPGCYVLRISTNGNVVTKQFIKE